VKEVTFVSGFPSAIIQYTYDEWSPIVAHLLDKGHIERANTALLLGLLWSGLAACVLGALWFDIGYWVDGR
jgi:hypothetical protein